MNGLDPENDRIADRDENGRRQGHIVKGHVNANEIEKGIEMEAVVTTARVRIVTQHAKHGIDHAAETVALAVEEAEPLIITIAKKALAVVRLDHVNHQKLPMNRRMKHQSVATTMNAIATEIAAIVTVIATVTIDLVIESVRRVFEVFTLKYHGAVI